MREEHLIPAIVGRYGFPEINPAHFPGAGCPCGPKPRHRYSEGPVSIEWVHGDVPQHPPAEARS